MNGNIIHVQTPLGTLVVTTSNDEEYPGIRVDLRRADCDYEAPIAWIEFTNSEADYDEGKLITRAWRDVNQEDYSDRVVHEGLDEFFGMEEIGGEV